MAEGGRDEHRLPGRGSFVFVCQGDYWTVSYGDRVVRLRDAKGLQQLAHLLHHPGREFHVFDLTALTDPPEASPAPQIDAGELARLSIHSAVDGDGDEPLDARARADLKAHIAAKRAELDDYLARELRDPERIAQLEDEIDLVTRELQAGIGLNGRNRKAGSAAERVRVRVTKNIGRALDHIAAKHEVLGRLLKSTIRTGFFCSYQPDQHFPVAWSFEAEPSSDANSSAPPDRPSGEARPAAEVGAQPTESELEPNTPSPAVGGLVWGQFIGRTQEIAALRAAIDAALAGQASLVMLVGEPGIGKTRLAEEAGVYARNHGAQVLVGRCYEGESASPYSPFVEVIREYVSTRPDAELKAELGNKAADLAKLVPEIRERIPDLPTSQIADQNGERMRLLDSVANFLINASKASPIMLQLEDLHWADKPTLLLLQNLARRFKGSRLLVVGTYRDVELDRSHPLSIMVGELRHERLYQRMLLRGLSESEVKELIEAISQQKTGEGAGEAFARAVLRETEGNPFFIEEVLRHLVESGALHQRDGRWVTDAKAVAEMKVPEDVRDLIERRLARLSKSTNRALEAAAVLGREFEFEVLGRMNELGKASMVPAIEEALRRRLVVEAQDGGRPRYAFTHALVRQTLVQELSLPRRQDLHLKAARAIEAVHESNLKPHVAALASHYRSAGATADPEKTIDYSIRAGGAAYALFAYEEAGAHWQAALGLMDEQGGGDRKRRAGLLQRLGDELVSGGAKAVEYMETAALLFEELGESKTACDVHSRLGLYLSSVNIAVMDMRRAMPHYKKAEVFLATQPESSRHAYFYLSLAAAYITTSRISDGLAAGKRAMEISERLDQPVLREVYWSNAAVITSFLLISSGSVTDGLQLAHQARRRADPIDDPVTGSAVAGVGGDNYFRLGDPLEAQDWYTQELAKPRAARSTIRRATLHDHLAGACIYMGELPKARAYLAEANAENKREGFPFSLHEVRFLFFDGQWELADKRLAVLAERTRTSGNRQQEFWAALELARLHRFRGDSPKRLAFLQTALEISVDGGGILQELHARSSLATLAADAGDALQALPHLQRCRQIVGAGENWLGLAGFVERAEAVVAAAQGEYSAAEAHFEKAIATFQCYCRPWEEADTLQYWGRALLAAAEQARAIEKFDAAIKMYRSRGAGAPFIEYVMVDKSRARDAKSRDSAVTRR
jgi:tetratricopeptide (TPR) repeat protein